MAKLHVHKTEGAAQPNHRRTARRPRVRYRINWYRCAALLFCVVSWILIGLLISRAFR